MFVDVKECRSGGLERFKAQLAASMPRRKDHVLVTHGGASGDMPVMPQQAHLGGSSSDGGPSLSPSKRLTPKQSLGDLRTAPDQQANTRTSNGASTPRFLLLCVNTRNLTQLIHVDLRSVQNDQLLFDGIRRMYWESRRNESWHFGLFTPQWLLNQVPNDWREWLETVHLRVPRSAELIQVSIFSNGFL